MEYIRLVDVCKELFAGGDIDKKKLSFVANEDNNVPIYTNGEENAGLYGYTNKARVSEVAITISARGTIGYSCLRTTPFYPAVRLIVAVPDTSKIEPKFLLYYINSKKYGGRGASIPQLTIPMLKNEVIPLFKMQHQKEIVSILDKIKAIIDADKKQLELLDETVKSRFIEMFGEPFNPLKKEYLYTFRDICSVHQGLQIPISKRKKEPAPNRYKYITIQYLNGKKEEEYIENPNSNVICTKNDILMTRTGNTGQVVTDVEGVFHNNFFIIDYDKEKVCKGYLLSFLRMEDVRKELLKRATTSTIPDLSHDKFFACPLTVPPIELQNEFASFVELIDKSKFNIQQHLNLMQELLDKKMEEFFGGE